MRKCAEMQAGCTPECHMSTSGPDPAQRDRFCLWQHGDNGTVTVSPCQWSVLLPQPTSAGSVCPTSHHRVETQSLRVHSFIWVHCIKFPAFHRITRTARDFPDQLVQPPAQHHLHHPKSHIQKQWPQQGSWHFPWLGKALNTINDFFLCVLLYGRRLRHKNCWT